jgi:hypothetical protein
VPRAKKKANTLVGTIEKKYHVDFGRRSNMHIGTLMRELRCWTLSELIEKGRKMNPQRRRRKRK